MEYMYMLSYLVPGRSAGYVVGWVEPDESGEIHRDRVLRDVTDQVERTHGPVAITFFSIEPRVIRTTSAAVAV